MPISFIPFDGWSPSPGYFGEGWAAVFNAMPFYAGWRPMRKWDASAQTVAFGPMTGSRAHLWSGGVATASYSPDQPTLFTGSKTRLFTVDPASGIFTDVSIAAHYAAANEPSGWHFESIGNDVWAINWLDPMQRRINNAGLFTNGVVSTFKPTPRFMATIREHLVVANLSNAGRFQDEIAWSDADDATNFDAPTLTSTSIAGSKRLVSISGQITGIVGGQYGLVFKRRGIFYLEYAGPPAIFRPDVLSPHIGTAFPASIINTRYGVFFLGPDGFYKIVDLSAPQKVSTAGLSQYLLDSVFSFRPATLTPIQEDTQMVAFTLPAVPLIGWIFRNDWTGAGNDRMLLFNPETEQWSTGDATTLPTLVPMLMSNPGSTSTVYNSLAALTWDGTSSRYQPLASSGVDANIRQVTLGLQFRPANFVDAGELQQSRIKGILPIFSDTVPFGSSLNFVVRIESALNPFQSGSLGSTTETRISTDRNLAGWYPFLSAGRFFRITLIGGSQDFANFEGLWIDQELLT